MAATSNGRGRGRKGVLAPQADAAHVEKVHEAEAAVDELEERQARLRLRARSIMGITGHAEGLPRLREVVQASGVGWYTLVALGLLVIVDQFQVFAFFIFAPEISHALGVSKSLLAFLIILRTLAVMLASLPMAAYVQTRPRRAQVSKVTAFGWSIATLLSAFVINIWGLLLVLLADGASTGSVQAVHTPLLVDSYPPEGRVRALSFYHGAGAIGSVVSPLVVGLFAGLFGMTWRGVFFAMGIICVIASVMALRLKDPGFGKFDVDKVQEEVRRDAGATSSVEADVNVELGFYEIVRRVLLIPTVVRLYIAWAIVGMMAAPFYSFFFFFLDERWHMSPGARSLFLASALAFSVPALAWFGKRGEPMFREDPQRLLSLVALTTALGAVALAVAAGSPFFVLMVVAFTFLFTSLSILLPGLGMVTLSVVPPNMRPHTAAMGGIFYAGLGGIAGVLLLNGIDRRFGTGGAITSMCVPLLIAAWLIWRTRQHVNHDLDRMIDEIVEREEIQILLGEGRHLPMLSCRHIDFSYGQLQVLFDVNFTVDDGEMVALLGTNGAGKSTLLRVISGLGLPSRGSVHFRGGEVTYLDAERRLGLGITQIPGGRAIFGPMTVVDNLRVYGHSMTRQRRAVDAGIDATFAAFPRLAERRNQLASTLSGGEQQMLALGKAFILKPRVLLIDELSLGLAPKIVGELLEMVRQVNTEGTAIVLVEQSVNIALSLVDHAYFMEKGEIRFDGRAQELLERPDLLRSVFLEGATKGLG